MTDSAYGELGSFPTRLNIASLKLIDSCEKLSSLCTTPPHYVEYNMAATLIAALPQQRVLLRTLAERAAAGAADYTAAQCITVRSPELARRVRIVETFGIHYYGGDCMLSATSLESLPTTPTARWVQDWVTRYRKLQPVMYEDLWWMVLADSSAAGWYRASAAWMGYFEQWIALPPPREQRHTPISITAALPRLRRLS